MLYFCMPKPHICDQNRTILMHFKTKSYGAINNLFHLIVARSRKSLATLTLGSSKIKSTLLTISRLWRYCGPSNYRFNFLLYWYAPWVFFEVVNVLSCSPFVFENTENTQLDWRIRHSHLAPTLFHSLVPWWRPRRIRPQITRLSQLENSAMGTWPIYKNSIIPDWFEKWRDIKFWYRC